MRWRCSGRLLVFHEVIRVVISNDYIDEMREYARDSVEAIFKKLKKDKKISHKKRG